MRTGPLSPFLISMLSWCIALRSMTSAKEMNRQVNRLSSSSEDFGFLNCKRTGMDYTSMVICRSSSVPTNHITDNHFYISSSGFLHTFYTYRRALHCQSPSHPHMSYSHHHRHSATCPPTWEDASLLQDRCACGKVSYGLWC